jgi:hypothetical protein
MIYAWPAVLLVISGLTMRKFMSGKPMDLWLQEHYQRLAGILVFILFFFWLGFRRADDTVSLISEQFPLNLRDVASVLIGSTVLGFAIFRMSGKASANRPTVKQSALTSTRLLSFAMVWIIYLVLYEFYFRGVLLSVAFTDAPIAAIVGINVFLYAAVHIVKNMQQVLLSVPFGLLLVGMTYYTGHFWFALIIHLVLALGVELSALITQRTKPVLL